MHTDGALLVFFRQPLSNPDELSHASRAYQISNGVLLTEEAVPGLSALWWAGQDPLRST
jgi:hypothetical protein